MDRLTIRNKNILNILEQISKTIISEDHKVLSDVAYHDRLGRDGKGFNTSLDIKSGTRYEYHKHLMELDKYGKHEGFPEASLLVDFKNSPKVELDLKKRDQVISLTHNLTAELGAEHLALVSYYPENGYIGWHHNANAGGYNVIFTYSNTGSGYFEEYNLKSGKYTNHQDMIGWSAKTGYFGSFDDDNNKKVWHCAANPKGHRITVSYIINQYDMWMDMKDELDNI